MKLSRIKATLTLLFLTLFLSQSAVFAQTGKKITISGDKITIKEALLSVEKQTEMSVAYNESALGAGKVISLKLKDASLENALGTILKGTGFTWKIEKGYIIISPEKKPAESKKISGTVIDETGLPIIGAGVVVPGGEGTVTDMDGKYVISARDGDVLEFSYLGYVPQSIPVSDKAVYDVKLQPDTELLDEVVVTALGIKRKEKTLGYNITEVKSDEITGAKSVNFVSSLSGKVAGLQINSSAGGAGAANKVVLRGAKSITKDNNVLYVIDGVPMFNVTGDVVENMYTRGGTENIADLNPEDIESMSVLTGPSAAALYGSNAANGAILITTKKGEAGSLKISLTHSTDFAKPLVTPRFQNTYGNEAGEVMSWGTKLETPSTYNPLNFFRTGFNTTTTLSVSTGTEKNQTFISLGATNSEGLMPNNDYNRYNFTVRNTAELIKDRLTFDFSAGYVKQNDVNPGTQGQYFNPLVALYLFPRGEDFSAIRLYERQDVSRNIPVQFWPYGEGGLSMQNPYWTAYRNLFTNSKNRYMFSGSLKLDITDWLNVVGRVRIDNDYAVKEKKHYASTIGKFADNYGYYSHRKINNLQSYADVIANIDKTWDFFSVSANIGASVSDIQYSSTEVRGHLKQIANFFSTNNIDLTANNSGVNSIRWREQTQSVFGSAEFGFAKMVYLTVTGRNDWASQLANTSKKSFFYPSVGLSAIVTEMFDAPEWLPFLKVRGSYSQVGSPISRNVSITTYPYSTNGTLETVSHYPISELYPEMTNSYEAGFDLKLFSGRVDMNFTWYKSNTMNQTFEAPISASTGYSSIIVQTGNVQNKGVEASLGYSDTYACGLKWNSQLTFSRNKNEVISLVDGFPDPITGEPINMPELEFSKTGTYLMKLVKGGSIGDIYATNKMFTDPHGDIYVDDSGKFGTPVEETFKVGNTNPDFVLGFRNAFTYKGFDLGFLFTARVGGEVVSATEAIMDNFGVSERSAIARDNGGVKVNNGLVDTQYFYQYIGGGETGMISQYVYDATNVRLQELTFGYDFPRKWFKNKIGLKVSFVGKNLWMIYNKAPFDPEVVSSTGTYYQGIDYFMLPSTRNLGFSIRLTY